jgi:hypothetical protein
MMVMDAYRPGRRLRTGREWQTLWIVGYAVAALVVINVIQGQWAWLALFVMILVPFLVRSGRKQRITKFNVINQVGLGMLEQDLVVDAERAFEKVEYEFGWPRFLPRLARYNRAMAVLKQGRLQETVTLLSEVDQAGGVLGLDAGIATNLAYAHALLGNVALAEQWLSEARRRPHKTEGLPHILTEIAIEIRAGRAANARKRLEDEWRTIERELSGARLRPLRVLRAFAIATTSDMRDGSAEHVIAGLRPVRRDEFAYMAKSWPELDQFLRTAL